MIRLKFAIFFQRLLAAVMLICLTASLSRAGMMLDLRFADGGTTKSLTSSDVNTDVPIQVWARIDSTGGTNGTGNAFGLQFVTYSIMSTRTAGGIDGGLQNPHLVTPFTAPGSTAGQLQDLNADSIGDLGSLANASNSAFVFPRGTTSILNTSAAGQTQHVFTSGSTVTGVELLIGTVDFHVGGLSPGQSTRFDVAIPSWILDGTPYGANWWQNTTSGLSNGLNNGAYTPGTGVTFSAVPEPSTGILAAIGCGLAWLWRKRFR